MEERKSRRKARKKRERPKGLSKEYEEKRSKTINKCTKRRTNERKKRAKMVESDGEFAEEEIPLLLAQNIYTSESVTPNGVLSKATSSSRSSLSESDNISPNNNIKKIHQKGKSKSKERKKGKKEVLNGKEHKKKKEENGKKEKLENGNNRRKEEEKNEETKVLPEESKEKSREEQLLESAISKFNFSINDNVPIYGRQPEKDFIRDHVLEFSKRRESETMYLCGHPGTGKTATLNSVLKQILTEEEDLSDRLKIFKYNAMNFKCCLSFLTALPNLLASANTATDTNMKSQKKKSKKKEIVYSQGKHSQSQGGKGEKMMTDEMANICEKLNELGDIPKIVVIDEFEQFLDEGTYNPLLRQDIQQLLSIPANVDNVLMIGIGNRVRIYPQLKEFYDKISGCRLSNCIFKVYEESHITQILTNKLTEAIAHTQLDGDFQQIIEQRGVDIIGKKVFNLSGDLRVAYDICKTVLLEKIYAQGGILLPIKALEVYRIINKKYMSKYKEILLGLNRERQLLLFALTTAAKKHNRQILKASDIFEQLEGLLKKFNLDKNGFNEFLDNLTSLESYGICSIKQDKKSAKQSKITLLVNQEELLETFSDLVFFKPLLSTS